MPPVASAVPARTKTANSYNHIFGGSFNDIVYGTCGEHAVFAFLGYDACTGIGTPARHASRQITVRTRVSAFSSPNVDAIDAASSISPLYATLTKNTRGVGHKR